jgi:hypothetical protein
MSADVRGHHLGGSVDEELLERAERSGGLEAVAALVDADHPVERAGDLDDPLAAEEHLAAAESEHDRPGHRELPSSSRRCRRAA